MDILVDLLVEQSNLYSQQCGWNNFMNDRELKAFIGVNYFMAINKLPNLQSYWDSDTFIGNKGIRNAITRNRIKDILQNIHFADAIKQVAQKIGLIKCTHLFIISTVHFWQLSDADQQSVDEQANRL